MSSSLDGRVRLYVYTSHFLSAWGDRMWQFGVGLFLVIIAPGSLRLTAVYGLSMGAAILLFGAHVGNMVDRVARLTAARLTLVVQNLSVAICAAIIYVVVVYKSEIVDVWPDEGLLTLCYGAIIVVAIVASLASTGNTISVERDWVVEICGQDGESLAAMSATMKGIDLTTNIIAPIATGQIMTYAGTDIGAIFIGGWNIVSVFVEYYLLWKVYNSVPALRAKKGDSVPAEAPAKTEQSAIVPDTTLMMSDSLKVARLTSSQTQGDHVTQNAQSCSCFTCLQGMLAGVTILVRGWKTFMQYDVAFAGLALAALYMTVLGFDNVTVGYAYTQGVNESIMGVLMAAGAAVGIFGTILYPRLHKCVGLVRTGLIGLFLEISVASLCVASIWAPGSPFDPFIRSRDSPNVTNTSVGDTEGIYDAAYGTYELTTMTVSNVSDSTVVDAPTEKLSIILLLTGIVGARCGLWIADLTITQLFLTRVREAERGVVLGVQTSLNQLMDMLKFIMVIAAPEPELFGILILISFGFICSGWLMYAKYARSVRGHLFHFNKIIPCDCLRPSKYERIEN